MASIYFPTAVRQGDAIGIVAPAGPVNCERFDRALGRLQARGFRLKTYGDLYRSRGYLAGDDATRAAELMAAFADPESSAVWCARGGYGVMRLLDRLDFAAIRRHPKVFIGFSDITALHVAIGQQTGLVTFHGPNLQDGFGKPDDMPPANEATLWQIIGDRATLTPLPTHTGPAEAAERPFPTPAGPPAHASLNRLPTAVSRYAYEVPTGAGKSLRSIRGGAATGQLTGGNLAVLCGMLGTPYEIETAGRILFLEDVGERLYRIDRYLTQLRLAGKLRALAGVLLGNFSYDESEQAEKPSEIASLLDEFFAPLGVPVLANFPAGHDHFNLTLPLGATIHLDSDTRQITLLENAVITA